jgi:hypothetical protein
MLVLLHTASNENFIVCGVRSMKEPPPWSGDGDDSVGNGCSVAQPAHSTVLHWPSSKKCAPPGADVLALSDSCKAMPGTLSAS